MIIQRNHLFGLYDRLTTAVLELMDPYVVGDGAPPKRIWPYLRSHFRPLRLVLVLSVIFTVTAATIEVWLISYAGRLIDTLAATPAAQIWQVHGRELLVAGVVILLLRPLFQFARGAINDIGIQCNAATLFRWRAHAHLSQQSVGWFQQDLSGRTASRLVDIGNHGSDTIYHGLNALAYGMVYMVGIVLLMASTDARLALPLLIWFALYAGLMLLIIPRMVRAQEAFQNARSALMGGVVDSFSNFDTLKLFADRATISADARGSFEATRQALFRARQIQVWLNTVLTALEGVIMVGFVGYGVWLFTEGAASIGLIGAAIALSLRITSMAEWMLDALWSIFQRVGSLREALKTIGQPITIPEAPGAPALTIHGGAIEITEARHHYGLGQGGLDGVTLKVEPGEKVGLVGRSGAGKSTLVNLILRFYEAEGGRIAIDGQDIRQVDQDSLRAAIGMVSQQAALLHRSVRDNIEIGRAGATMAEIEAAAREARADQFVADLRDGAGRAGYDAHVGERGVKLSGGQRQRIALARVILKNAPILILDEATSALDSEVEAEIQDALQEVMRRKTVIAIAHRLSTIAQMDRIIVLDAGRVVEQGSHAELLRENGLYAMFWRRQSGGFIGTEEEEPAT